MQWSFSGYRHVYDLQKRNGQWRDKLDEENIHYCEISNEAIYDTLKEGEKIWRAKGIALSSVFSSVTRKDGGHWSSLYSSEGNLFLI